MPFVGFLMARGLSGLVANLIVWGVIAAVGIGAIAGIRHWIGAPYYDKGIIEGKAAQTKIDKPIIAKLEGDVSKLTGERDQARAELAQSKTDLAVVVDANRTVTEKLTGLEGQLAAAKKTITFLDGYAAKLRQANQAMLKRLDDAIAKSQPVVDAARTIAVGPPAATFEQSCRDADDILLKLARRMHAT